MLFLRSPSIARRAFGFNGPGELVRAVPRMRFMFFTEFVLSEVGQQMTNFANLNTYQGNRGISFKVRQIDKPKINLTTQDLNQYNKKKVIYTKIEYPEMNIRLYDTVDDSVLALWVDYFTYYFGDSRFKSDRTAYSQSPIDGSYVDNSGWGLRPLAENTQFFDSIRLLAFYANTYTAFKYINPKITMVDWQQRDYSSNDPEELSIHFKYEAIEYEAFGEPYDPTTYGWLSSDSLDLARVSLSNGPSVAIPRIFSSRTSAAIDQADALARYTPPTLGDEEVAEIQRYFSPAPGASLPAEASPEAVVPGAGRANFGTATVQVVNSNPTTLEEGASQIQAGVFTTAEQNQADLLRAQSAVRQRDATARQDAIDQGLIPADSDASVRAITGAGGITVAVEIDGQRRDLSLGDEQQARLRRAQELGIGVRQSRVQTEM